MAYKQKLARLAAAAVLATAGAAAHADFVEVNLAGWEVWGGLFNLNNGGTHVYLGAGAEVTDYEYVNLSFSAQNGSWRSEFVLTVSHDVPNMNLDAYLDYRPASQNSQGNFGPASGFWSTGVASRKDGAPFLVGESGMIWVTTWDTYDDAGRDAIVNSGLLRIHFTPAIPEPASVALLALGLGTIGLAVRRRRQKAEA